MTDPQYEKYRGMKTLLVTRVSTPKQEEGYGHPAQEQQCREKLVSPLALKVVDTLRVSHSGLDFLEDEIANKILKRAKYKEFDLVIADVLDRIGRKGMERELWRMQLRATGARLLTTDPADHADDDTLTGEIIRLINGHGSEQEVNNTKRRTMNGIRAKAQGLEKDGKIGQRKVVGNGHRLYGYIFVRDDKGKKINFTLNYDVIHVDQFGEEWTEVKVVVLIFESIASGQTLLGVADYLNSRGIPSPHANLSWVQNQQRVSKHGIPIWQKSEISRLVHQSDYWGERREFKTKQLEKKPGLKTRPRRKTKESERILIPVPAIVSKELAAKAHISLEQNAKRAKRNNPDPEDTLLRAGYAKCALCGATLTANRDYKKASSKTKHGYYVSYVCGGNQRIGKCRGCRIPAHTIDDAAWEYILNVVKDPSRLEKSILAERTKDPTATRRKNINKKLAEVKEHQDMFRKQLADLMKTGKLDKGTQEYLASELQQLADREEEWKTLLAKEEGAHDAWKEVEKKLAELRQECEKLRDIIDNDCKYVPSYKTKRDFVEHLGVVVTVWPSGHINPQTGKPERFKIGCNPPSIEALIAFHRLKMAKSSTNISAS